MSWSPGPEDYEIVTDGNEPIRRRGRDPRATEASPKQVTQLPSQQARQGGGGIAAVEKSRKKREKSARSRNIEMTTLPPRMDHTEVAVEERRQPYPSAASFTDAHSGGSGNISDEAFFEEFTYKDLDGLKELNCSMARKKEIRAKLIADEGKVTGKSKWSSDTAVRWRRFKENATDALNRTKLWESSLHEIEGRFGTSIRSYFAFLRWLFLLNLCLFLLIFIFIVVPTISFENLTTSGIASTITSERNISAQCTYNPYNPNAINNFPQYIIWWFTGQGFMENTLLFYGYYDNAATVVQTVGVYFYYNIPLAYLLVSFFYFLLSLILVVRKAAYGLQETITFDDRYYSYCNRVFNGWDYCINDDRSARLKHKNIKHELEVDLEEDKIKDRQAKRSKRERVSLYAKRIAINFVVIVLLVASLVAIFFAAQYALQNGSTYDDNFFLDLIITYLTSIVITMANFIAPVLFGILIKYEDYSPDFTIRFTLIRTVVLRLASIVFLYVVVYLQINCNRYNNIVSTEYIAECNHCVGVECWETYLGQEMYKLTLLDFFIVIAVTLFVEFPRRLIVQHCKCGLSEWIGQQEFDIAKTVLDLVYAQTVGWIGAFYAPLLPVMVVLKFFVFFYLKKLTLLYNCRPASQHYRTSRSGTFFYIILLFGFAVAVFPVVISVSIITPSIDCGPFRNWPYMFYAVTASIQTLPTWAREMFWFFGSAGFAGGVVVVLCLILYYFYASSSAHKATIRLLKNQLTLEGKDKQFLLKRLTQLGDDYMHSRIHSLKSDSHVGIANQPIIPKKDDALPGQIDSFY